MLAAKLGRIHPEGHANPVAGNLSKKFGIVARHGSFQGQGTFKLHGRCRRKFQSQTARPYGRQQTEGLAGHQNKYTVVGWILQGLEKGIRGVGREPVGVVNDTDFMRAEQWTVDHVTFNLSNLIDFNLRVGFLPFRLDHQRVGIGTRGHLATGSALSAGVRLRRSRRGFHRIRLEQTGRP